MITLTEEQVHLIQHSLSTRKVENAKTIKTAQAVGGQHNSSAGIIASQVTQRLMDEQVQLEELLGLFQAPKDVLIDPAD